MSYLHFFRSERRVWKGIDDGLSNCLVVPGCVCMLEAGLPKSDLEGMTRFKPSTKECRCRF